MSKLLPIFRLDNFDDFGGRVEVAFASASLVFVGRPLSRCTPVELWLRFAESSRCARWKRMVRFIHLTHCPRGFTLGKWEDLNQSKLQMRLVEQSNFSFDRFNFLMAFLVWTTTLSLIQISLTGQGEGQSISLRENHSTEL